jgi:predicted nucleic acid-binding protein
MLIISDNSAVSALAESGLLPILSSLFGAIVLTESVRRECGHPPAPAALREWIADRPGWVTVQPDPIDFLPETANLGAGEASAISLAWEHRQNSLLILDEKRGRRVAIALGLPVTGVAAIVGQAAQRGLVVFDEVLRRLAQVDFHLSDAVVEVVRKRCGL